MIERFSPITLDELNDAAALQTRIDRKYVVERADLPALLAGLPDGVRVMTIEGRTCFGYASVYHDTADLESYRLAATKRRLRYKVRTRRYMDSGLHFVEVKTTGARGATVKQRVAYRPGPSRRLTAIGRSYVDDVLSRALVTRVNTGDLEPLLETTYRRTTLLLPDGARVTLDIGLAWTDLVNGTHVERPEMAIVETKTGATPSAMDRVLWAAGIRPVKISKFGTGLAALRGDLPATKWRRVLRDWFAAAA